MEILSLTQVATIIHYSSRDLRTFSMTSVVKR